MKKIYKEAIKAETETNINVLYSENKIVIYTNKVSLQKQLNKLIGEPTKEYKIKRSIAGSLWEVSLEDKNRIQKLIVKATINTTNSQKINIKMLKKDIKIVKCGEGN